MRLLNHIFSTATDVPEFQRQLVIPNVPKFSLVLIALADKHGDRDVKVRSEIADYFYLLMILLLDFECGLTSRPCTVISDLTSSSARSSTNTHSKTTQWLYT